MEKVKKDIESSILEKVAIIIDIMICILGCSYSEAYEIVTKSKTFYYLQQKDYSTLHDSPQANLASIGEELRQNKNALGCKITPENIKKAMLSMREANLCSSK